MQHCSGVAAAAAGMAKGIVEEGIVGEETVEEIGYGEIGFLDGISSTQETKNSVGLVVMSRGPGVEILYRRLRRMPLMVRIR